VLTGERRFRAAAFRVGAFFERAVFFAMSHRSDRTRKARARKTAPL
jgi:hypothetical protein